MSARAIPAAEPESKVQVRLPLTLQIVYGIGEIPITATMGLVGIYVLLFYNSVMKLDGALAGFGVTAGLVVDALIDPYIGFRSDRSQRRLGRRQSYMLFGCLGMGPCFWALLSPPQHLSTWPLFCWLLISSLLFRVCFAAYRIPYMSLGAELSTDYDRIDRDGSRGNSASPSFPAPHDGRRRRKAAVLRLSAHGVRLRRLDDAVRNRRRIWHAVPPHIRRDPACRHPRRSGTVL